jgi:hypothetical protein
MAKTVSLAEPSCGEEVLSLKSSGNTEIVLGEPNEQYA